MHAIIIRVNNMKVFNYWEFWVIVYLISATIFAHTFKKANRNMKNAGSLTILLEIFTALFSLFIIPLFEFKIPTNPNIYFTLFIVTIIYAATDRLNIEARYGLDPSTFSMLKQLSTVFMIIFGLLFFNEELVINKIIGAVIIVLANVILAFEKGKFRINKYFIMAFISNFLFAIAMSINVNIAENFNIAFYTIITVLLPAIYIFIFERHNFKELKSELALYNKKQFLISAFTWALMLISSVKAYELGSIIIVAPLFALTSIINALIEFFFTNDKNKLAQKLISAILLIIGVILVRF